MADDFSVTPTGLRPRSEPVQARSRRNRRKVLDAAHALLKARGVHALTTVAIAEASGVSIGTVYRFFPNKGSIICQLFEEKLAQIRELGLANRDADAGTASWREFFGGYFTALKAAERQVDFDFSLADAIFKSPELWEIDKHHGVLVADQIVADMKQFGARWSDEALFDLAINLYAMDAAIWMYWRYSQGYPALAVARVVQASLDMMRPAIEGEPEPPDPPISRARLLAGDSAVQIEKPVNSAT